MIINLSHIPLDRQPAVTERILKIHADNMQAARRAMKSYKADNLAINYATHYTENEKNTLVVDSTQDPAVRIETGHQPVVRCSAVKMGAMLSVALGLKGDVLVGEHHKKEFHVTPSLAKKATGQKSEMQQMFHKVCDEIGMMYRDEIATVCDPALMAPIDLDKKCAAENKKKTTKSLLQGIVLKPKG